MKRIVLSLSAVESVYFRDGDYRKPKTPAQIERSIRDLKSQFERSELYTAMGNGYLIRVGIEQRDGEPELLADNFLSLFSAEKLFRMVPLDVDQDIEDRMALYGDQGRSRLDTIFIRDVIDMLLQQFRSKTRPADVVLVSNNDILCSSLRRRRGISTFNFETGKRNTPPFTRN